MGQLLEGAILCTIDFVGLYPNIPRKEGLTSLGKFSDAKMEKKVTTETFLELAEIVLKNNIFQFNEKTTKQSRVTAVGTKFAPPCVIYLLLTLREGF